MAESALVGVLRVLLTANTAEYTTGLKGAARSTEQFEKAVSDTKGKLEAIGVSARGAEQQFRRLATSFSGEKLIRDAVVTADAVKAVGGAAVLTEKELRKIAPALDAAREKARLMGAEMPASFHKVADAVKAQVTQLDAAAKGTTAWGGALGSVKTLAMGFAAGFTLDRVVRGIGSAISETIAWGGAITDLSAKTGVSMVALQKWEYAAKQSGNTLDQVVTASLQLSKRIEEGDKEVEEALAGLKLNLSALQSLRPEEQFDAVAEALAKTSDQGQRASAAMALFGRSGADLLPTLTSDMKALGDEAERLGVIVDDQTLKAMDDLGDSWQKLKDAGRGLLADVLSPLVPQLNELAQAATNAGRAFREDLFGTLLKFSAVGSGGFLGLGAGFVQQFGGSAPKQATRATGGTTAGVSAAEFFGSQLGLAGQDVVAGVFMRDLVPAARASATALRQVAQSAAVLRDANIFDPNRNGGVSIFQRLPFVSPSLLQNPAVLGGQANPWGGVSQITSAMGWNGPSLSPLMKPGFNWAGAGLAGVTTAMPFLSQLITGGNRNSQVGGSVGGSLGGAIGSMSSVIGALGSFAPFLGPVAGIVGSLIGKLFGPSRGAVLGQEADARIGQTQAGLLQQYGSVDAIRGMGPYGAALADAWGSKNVQGEAWFDKLNKGLQEQLSLQSQIKSLEEQRAAINDSLKTTWDQVVSIAERYGISLEGLGGQVAQLGATTTWTQMLNDLQALERAGGDVGGILVGMKDEISAMVAESQRIGTEIPENFKPYIQNLADTGQLLDANGDAITDLAGITWGPAVQTQADIARTAMEKLDTAMQALVARLDQLIDRLATGLPSAAETGARGAKGAIDTIDDPGGRGGGDPTSSAYGARGGLVTPDGIQYRALGGAILNLANRWRPRGTDTVPAMLTPGELVLTARQQQALYGALSTSGLTAGERLHGGAGGGDQTIVVIDGRGSKDDVLERVLVALPRKARQNEMGFRTLLREALGVTA